MWMLGPHIWKIAPTWNAPFAMPLRSTITSKKLQGHLLNYTVQIGNNKWEQQRTAFYQGLLPPLAPSQPREWHASITPDLRKHLTGKLFHVSYQTSNFVWRTMEIIDSIASLHLNYKFG
jgi:hypothetical protein